MTKTATKPTIEEIHAELQRIEMNKSVQPIADFYISEASIRHRARLGYELAASVHKDNWPARQTAWRHYRSLVDASLKRQQVREGAVD